MSWKPRNAGWDRGMKRYQKKGGGYGYYDPNSDGVEYMFWAIAETPFKYANAR